MHRTHWAALAACTALLVACGGGDKARSPAAADADGTAGALAAAGNNGSPVSSSIQIAVLSSAPQWVSGGDARIEVRAGRGLHPRIELWLNGQRINPALQSQDNRLEGVISGLTVGQNLLEVRTDGRVRNSITLTNHPVTGPMFSGPQQHPFVCTTIQSAVARPPLVDTATPPGYPVADSSGNTIGYSRDCSINTFVAYFYRNTAGSLVALPPGGTRPADMGTTTLPDGRTVDFIIRREIGSINRFLYSIAMLAPLADNPAAPDTSLWNKRLLYWFQGGVAVGHSQGTVHGGSMNLDILGQGFAIVHSSGNNTGTHYNMTLAGETAMMTKERFIERYGVPHWTVGLGGSGGAIQQYLIAQNQPGVLDGLLPVQSYPDMVTQTIHVGDCELLEHYMDATDRNNAKWRTTKNRSWLVGFNAEEGFTRVNDPFIQLKAALGYSSAVGTTECVPAWRGLTPLAMNPLYGQAPNQQLYQPQSDIAAIRWTHYDDLRNVYGVDATGAARPTWDNVGVQYGLKSLRAGLITPAEFLHLNFNIGGWKHPSQMVQEGFPFFGTSASEVNKALTIPGYFDPWSLRNMNLGTGGAPAPRTVGDPIAMSAAYTSGHVFSGKLDVPALDHRQYMERELDMHNSPVLRGAAAGAQPQRPLRQPGGLVHRHRPQHTQGQPDAAGAAGDEPVAGQHQGQPEEERGPEQAGGGGRRLLRPLRRHDEQRQRRVGRHPRQPQRRRLHAGLPAVRHLAHRGGGAHPGRHLPLRAQERGRCRDRWHLRQLDARRHRAGAAAADLPQRRVRLQPARPGCAAGASHARWPRLKCKTPLTGRFAFNHTWRSRRDSNP